MEIQGWIQVRDKGGATKDFFFRGDLYILYPEYHFRNVHMPPVELGGDGTVPLFPYFLFSIREKKEIKKSSGITSAQKKRGIALLDKTRGEKHLILFPSPLKYRGDPSPNPTPQS